jgi:enterobactin synthetase component D
LETNGYLKNENLCKYGRKSILLFQFNFDTQAYYPGLYNDLCILFPVQIQKSVPKRQSGFLAGRYAAQSILKHLNINITDIHIGKNRAPVWPDKVVASITHTDDMAMCAVSNNTMNDFLGIDAENWMTSDIAEATKRQVLNDRESELLRLLPISINQQVTLIFSAKESLFKAIYPQVEKYFGFEAAEVVDVNEKSMSIELRLTQNLSENLLAGHRFTCEYFPNNSFILTMVVGKLNNIV